MKEIHCDSSVELMKALEELDEKRKWIFRGQSDCEWDLIPRIGRKEFGGVFNTEDEKRMIKSWKRYAHHFLDKTPNDEWGWLTLAQHHGLATRLLDWTKNPLNATFFAIQEKVDRDSALYALKPRKGDFVDEDDDPLDTDSFGVYFPKGISARVVNQRGVFTVSEYPSEPLKSQVDNEIVKIFLTNRSTVDIRRMLELFDVNDLSIYRDLDSLSTYLNKYYKRINTEHNEGIPAELGEPEL